MGKKLNDDYKPHNTISVESIDEYSKKVEKLGGKILPKVEIPGIGWYALATDPEGNQFGIMQPMEMR